MKNESGYKMRWNCIGNGINVVPAKPYWKTEKCDECNGTGVARPKKKNKKKNGNNAESV
jgi:hypothetical protein